VICVVSAFYTHLTRSLPPHTYALQKTEGREFTWRLSSIPAQPN
jgi:hypothetical protein